MSTLEQEWLMDIRGGDVRAFFGELGIVLKPSGEEAMISCFANPAAHRRDDRNASCSVSLITGLWLCHGCGAKGNAYQAAIAVGSSETAARLLAQRFGLFLEKPQVKKPRLPTEVRLRKWRQALRSQPLFLHRLFELKGWTREAIIRCGLGWDGERITFPVRNKRLKVIGLARYLPGGDPKMTAVTGSTRGLFPAPESIVISRRRPLFLVEGEPAAVSVWAAGHQAVGIPGAHSWRPEWAQRLYGHKLVMLPDCDQEGRELARRVKAQVASLQIVDIEPGCDDRSDIGDWIAGAGRHGGLGQITRLLDRLVAV